jgi:cytochrome c553
VLYETQPASHRTPLKFNTQRPLGWVIVAALPFVAHGASIAQQEYASVLRSKADLVHGEKLFETCAACHGTNGGGVSDGTVPAIAAQHFRVLARELVDYRHDKRWDVRMEHFTTEHHLSGAQDIADVAAYISSVPATHSGGRGSGEYLVHGAQVYAQQCASCHGAAAEGDDLQRYPRLAGQHYEYLLRQLHDAVEGRRPNFPSEHIRLLERFQRPEFVGVADYLARLGS